MKTFILVIEMEKRVSVDQSKYAAEIAKNERVYLNLVVAKELEKTAQISWSDAAICSDLKREFWLAAFEDVSKNGRSFGLVAECVNFRFGTSLDRKVMPKVLRILVPEFREWEESVRAPKRKAREELILKEMTAEDLQKFTIEKTVVDPDGDFVQI